MRLFLAVTIPEPVKEILAAIQALIEPRTSIAWTKVDQLHLTLKFYGDVKTSLLETLVHLLLPVIAGLEPRVCSLGNFGTFPTMSKPRVLWVDLDQGSDAVVAMAQKVDVASAAQGFEVADKPFRPHITLGRVRRASEPVNLPLIRIHEKLNQARSVAWKVDALVLFESRLHASGAEHIPIETFQLRAV